MQADGAVSADGSGAFPDGAVDTPDAGSVIPSEDAGGGVGPTQDTSVPTPSEDTGAPTGEEDAGSVTPTQDSGTTTPPKDAGSDATTSPMDAAADTSTPTMDSGPEAGPPDATPMTPETSTEPTTCSGAPTYPMTTSCAKCTCMKCNSQVKNCYASSEANKNSQCAMVQACAEQNQCVQEGCYCGQSSCLSPSGPCKNLIEQVAGGGPLSVSRAEGDPQHALGRASLIGACQLQNCRSECGLQ